MNNPLFFCKLNLDKYISFQKFGAILPDCSIICSNPPVLLADYVQPCQNLEP